MDMKVHRWKTITALAAAASLVLAIGAAPSQAATLVESTRVSGGLSARDLSKLPLTDRHLTKHEKANLAVVLRAYRVAEGDVLDAQGFIDLFADDGVLNGIGGVEGQTSLRGEQLGGLVVWMGTFLPDVHRHPAGVHDVDEHDGVVVREVDVDVVRRVVRPVVRQ